MTDLIPDARRGLEGATASTQHEIPPNRRLALSSASPHVEAILLALGEDPERDGLKGTPVRVIKALLEMTAGYAQDPASVLKVSGGGTGFDVPYDEMVVVAGIEFWSLCEHHMLPFGGTVDLGYLPDEGVVGLSKVPRLVEVFARRLQVQERLTDQIAEAFQEVVQPRGVGVRVRAQHLCTACRGVRKRVTMTTCSLTGRFRAPEVRAEFFAHLGA